MVKRAYFINCIFVMLSFVSIVNYAGELTVIYDGNGSDAGTVPIDSNTYSQGDDVFVKWSEPLTKSGYIFANWNTQPDGSGNRYSPDAESSGATLRMGSSNITLYAQWGKYSTRSAENYALTFNDSIDTYESVLTTEMPAFTNALTVEGWIYPTSYGIDNESVIVKLYGNNDSPIQLKSGEHVLSWCGWTAYGSTTIPLNTWTHFAVILKNDRVEAMYINGQPDVVNGDNSITMPVVSEWVIGNETWSKSPYRWQGKIDEIRVWNTARTAEEITSNYQKELKGDEAGLFAYWNFNKNATGAVSPHTNTEMQNIAMLCDIKEGGTHYGLQRNMETIDWADGAPVEVYDDYTVTVSTNSSGDYNCDGQNDEIEINNAILDVFNHGKGTVHLNNGTYIIDNPIIMRSNVTFEGESEEDTVIKLKDEADWGRHPTSDYTIYHDAESFIIGYGTFQANEYWDFKIGRIENVTLRNFKMDGNAANQHYTNLNGETIPVERGTSNYIAIDLGNPYNSENYSKNLIFSHINVINNHGDAISLSNVDGVTVDHCKTSYIGHSSVYLMHAYNVVVEYNSYDIYANSGVRLDVGNHIIIRDNHLFNTTMGGNFGIQITQREEDMMDDLVIERNLIEDIPYAGIELYAIDPAYTDGVIIRNNLIYRCGLPSVANESAGINVFNFNNLYIENNTIFNNCGGGIIFGVNPYDPATLTGNKTVYIRNNIITASFKNDQDILAYGIYVKTTDSTTLILKNNNVWDNESGGYFNCSSDVNSISQDSKFVAGAKITNKWDEYPALNLHIQASSPCVDAGTSDVNVTKDYEKYARPSGASFDIGAFEYYTSSGGNYPPVANAGNDQTINDDDGDGFKAVSLDGSASSDSDGTIVSYSWYENGQLLGTGVTQELTLSVGIHTITLTVKDNNNSTATDNVTITVKDTNGGPATGNRALEFNNNSINEYVKTRLGETWTSIYTVEMWVYPQLNSDDMQAFFHSGDGDLTLARMSDGSLGYGGWSVNGGELKLNEWSHVVLTSDGTTAKLYIDGVEIASGAYNGEMLQADTIIGNLSETDNSLCWKGRVDEVRIWNYVRSSIEIHNSWEIELTGSENGLLAYYNLNEGTGTNITDKTQNNYNATLFNMEEADWVNGFQSSTVYILTVNNGLGDGNYVAGSMVNIIAEAAPAGQHFVNWTGGTATNFADISSATTTYITVSADETITANYALDLDALLIIIN